MRIQKLISQRGIASRRKAEEMILAGRITVNGRVCGLGDSADPDTDDIRIDGKPLPAEEKRVYILLHKPRGYVTTLSDDRGRKTVAQLVADCGCRVYPCGRLDYDTEGLLLLTNDGAFANSLMHPSHEVTKTYEVTVSGMTDEALHALSQPVTLDGYRIRKPLVRLLRTGEKALVEVIIHEGRNRQVRRMCDLAGLKVHRLKRVKEGALSLGDLPCGAWRYLTQQELILLQKDGKLQEA